MDDLKELYQEIILDHNKNPKNYGKLEEADKTTEGYNPLCGDRITLYLKVENEIIVDIRFEGTGCAISKASTSIMTSVLKNRSISEARQIFSKFQELITEKDSGVVFDSDLEELSVFSGVCEFPVRVKCASLAWHTLLSSFDNGNNKRK